MVTPRVSVVVPTRDRPAQLATCLAALRAQSLPAGRFEVVVVNDGGDAGQAERVVAECGSLARVCHQDPSGPASARNHGARVAHGVWLAMTDDDCRPEPEWLASLCRAADAWPGRALGGQTTNLLGDNAYAEASQGLVEFLYRYFNRDPRDAVFFTSNNLMVPREPFLDLGGFDESFTRAAAEDRDFCDRWRHTGGRLVFVPDARVGHAHPLTFRSFVRQHFNYGRGAALFHERRVRRGEPRVKVEPWRFYAEVVAAPFRRAAPGAALPQAALLVLTQAANAAGFFTGAVGRRSPAGPDARPADVVAPSKFQARE
jgi:GT2 family glycosyltransferase